MRTHLTSTELPGAAARAAAPAARTYRGGQGVATATPWLPHAPPWHDDDHGVNQRASKRIRSDAQPTAAEHTLRKYTRPDIAPRVSELPHKAARLLEHHLCRRGAGIHVHTKPWTTAQLQHAAARGSHKSAKDEVEFVCEELMAFCDQGLWTVLPLSVALLLPHLRLPPASWRRASAQLKAAADC